MKTHTEPFQIVRVPGDPPVIGLVDEGLGNTSWAVGLGEVVVVDPERDPAPYVAAAETLGGPIVLAAETHLHADFVTGSGELAAHEAAVVAAAGDVAWDHRPVTPGDEIDLGRCGRWRRRATPRGTCRTCSARAASRERSSPGGRCSWEPSPAPTVVADAVDVPAAIWVVAVLTAASGIVVAVRMYETRLHPSL